MSAHTLNIKATLDTSSLQTQLDKLNNRKSGQNGQGGNNGGANFTQLNASINRLNTTLAQLIQAIRGNTSQRRMPISVGNTDNGALIAMMSGLGSAGALGKIKIPYPQRGKILQDMYDASKDFKLSSKQFNRNYNKLKNRVSAKGNWDELSQHPEILGKIFFQQGVERGVKRGRYIVNQNLGEYNKNLEKYRQQVEEAVKKHQNTQEANAQRRMTLQHGLAISGHFASQIGTGLEAAGYQKAGSAFNVFGGIAGGAAAGTTFGPIGTVIGGVIGGITTLATELKKMSDAADEAAKRLQEMRENIRNAFQSVIIGRNAELVNEDTEKILEDFEDLGDRKSIEALYDKRNEAQRNWKDYESRANEAYENMWQAQEAMNKNPSEANKKAFVQAQKEYNEQKSFSDQYKAQFKALESKRKAYEKFKADAGSEENLAADLAAKEDDFREAIRLASELAESLGTELSRIALTNNMEANPYLKFSMNRQEWVGRKSGSWEKLKSLQRQLGEATSTDEIKEIQKKIAKEQAEFSFSSNILKQLRPEMVMQQMQGLQGLTGLAAIGGNLGEKYQSDELMEKLDKFTQQLYQIIENTAKEESVSFQ